jgi:hypothetical protein
MAAPRLTWELGRLGAVGLGLMTLACGHERMLPASSANVVPGARGFAVVQRNGVNVEASGDDWSGRPDELEGRLTPVKVWISNHSGKAIQILYERFVLAGGDGRRYRPLPPVPLLHDRPLDAHASLRPIFATASFFVRPAFRDVYPSIPPWPTRLQSDDQFYETQYKLWGRDLPTVEMQRKGLPEGVLADGGEMSGFLYFENAIGRESRVSFEADLEDGEGQDRVTSIAIPFRIE